MKKTLGRSLSVATALIACWALPSAALAQGETGNVCVRDYRGGAVCTANDVRIEALTVISVIEDCVSGTPGETAVVFEALVSSAGSPNRYDIGLFLALDGGSARDGDSCFHDFLSGALTATPTYVEEDAMVNGPGPMGEETIIDGPWWDGAGDADLCGDIESNSRLRKTLPPLRFACIDTNGDGSADVSVCTSWDNNVGSACNSVADAFPGTNSKCSCAGVELGIVPEPAITIVKSPALQSVPSGGTANFSFTVTSKTTISNVMVSDPDCDAAPAFTGGDTNADSILTPDETWTYICSKTGVMADFMNTVTVTGDGPLGPVNDTDMANVVVAPATMTLAKTGVRNDPNMDGFAQAGETISYSFTVTNTGTVALTNVAVTDPMVSPITCPSGNPIPTLGVGTMETCVGTYTIVQADIDAGQKVNTATATSNETPPVMDTNTVLLPAPGMTLVKTGVWNDANMDGVAQAGETISYSFKVTNTGTIALTNVAVTDPMVSPIACPSGNPIASLGVGVMETCAGTYTIVQADVDAGQKVNTATATSNETPPVMDTTTVTLPANPAMTLVKTGVWNDANMDSAAQAGETISYSFTVTNTGAVTLTNVAVTDPMVSPITCPSGNPIASLGVGVMETCTGTYTIVQADVDAGQKVNTATATSNETPPVMDTTTVILPGGPALTLVKTGVWNDANMDGVAQAGETISYSFTVTNTGAVTLTNVGVTDPMVSPITCPSGNPIASLGVGVMETCTGTYTIVQADVNAGQKVNTATATSNETPPVMDTTTVTLPGAAAMTLAKTGVWNDANLDGAAQVGETISYSFTVTNTGAVTLTNVAVTDPMVSPITCPSGNPIASLGVGVMETCTGTYTIVQADVDAGQKVNTATATSNETPPVMDTTTVTLPGVAENPAIGVAKRVLGSVVPGPGVNEFDVTFELLVENLGNVALSSVQVTDDLTATFPAPVTFSVLAAPATTGTLAANAGFDGAGDPNLLVAAGSTLAVGASGTITFTVRITVAATPAGPFFNTANASGLSPTAAPVNDVSDDGTDPDPNGSGNGGDPGENDPTQIVVPGVGAPVPIPTVSEWGMLLLTLLLASGGLVFLRRRRV